MRARMFAEGEQDCLLNESKNAQVEGEQEYTEEGLQECPAEIYQERPANDRKNALLKENKKLC
jgi:hypothetical protein